MLRALRPTGGMHTLVLIGELDRVSAHTLEAEIEPVAYGKLPALPELPMEGRCKLAAVDYGAVSRNIVGSGTVFSMCSRSRAIIAMSSSASC